MSQNNGDLPLDSQGNPYQPAPVLLSLSEARQMLQRLGGYVDLSEYEPAAEPGECDDCVKTQEAEHPGYASDPLEHNERWQYGNLTLCRHCALHRIRVAHTPVEEPRQVSDESLRGLVTRMDYLGMLVHWVHTNAPDVTTLELREWLDKRHVTKDERAALLAEARKLRKAA
jgi:hypothetical protein